MSDVKKAEGIPIKMTDEINSPAAHAWLEKNIGRKIQDEIWINIPDEILAKHNTKIRKHLANELIKFVMLSMTDTPE